MEEMSGAVAAAAATRARQLTKTRSQSVGIYVSASINGFTRSKLASFFSPHVYANAMYV
jgi:hypothetical protein